MADYWKLGEEQAHALDREIVQPMQAEYQRYGIKDPSVEPGVVAARMGEDGLLRFQVRGSGGHEYAPAGLEASRTWGSRVQTWFYGSVFNMLRPINRLWLGESAVQDSISDYELHVEVLDLIRQLQPLSGFVGTTIDSTAHLGLTDSAGNQHFLWSGELEQVLLATDDLIPRLNRLVELEGRQQGFRHLTQEMYDWD